MHSPSRPDLWSHRADTGSRPARRRSGFTLLEILLVLAIIGLMASVLISGATNLLSDKPVTPDEVFWKAVQEARAMSLKSEREVTFQYVDDVANKTKEFVVSNGESTKNFPIVNPGDLDVSFLAPQSSGNLAMVAGVVLDTSKIPAVTFYPDGTCTPFKVQFYRSGAAHTASIDPWTCAPVLTTGDNNNSGPGNPS
ncbi:MAG TPA: type II secretion system protein [Opitutaceae bacterium]|nr:type II secretion system protein [Opitutaceae bacterium]